MRIKEKSLLLVLISALFIYNTCTFIRLQYSFYLATFLYVIVFLWALQAGWLKKTFFLHSSIIKWFVLLTCFSSLIYVHGGSYQWTTFFGSYIQILFWILAFEIVAKNFSEQEIKHYLNIHILLMIFWSFATIRALAMYPMASRAMYGHAAEISDTSFLHSMGCGGYGFIYGLVFISMALFHKLLKQWNNISQKKFLLLVPIVIFGYTIIKGAFTTALIMLILSAILLLFYARTEKHGIGILLLFATATFIFGFYSEFIDLIYAIGELFGINLFMNKMEMINQALNAEDIERLSRFQNYYASWLGFIANPIVGSSGAGGDSQILVHLSYMGLGGLTYIGFLHSAFTVMKNYIDKQFVNIIEILTVFLALFNTFKDMTSISVVFFLTPCLMLADKKSEVANAAKDEVINESVSN
ncbi:hypothetical protein IKS86_06330 [bacterium]|nr:hypothetical protein [bacterium]